MKASRVTPIWRKVVSQQFANTTPAESSKRIVMMIRPIPTTTLAKEHPNQQQQRRFSSSTTSSSKKFSSLSMSIVDDDDDDYQYYDVLLYDNNTNKHEKKNKLFIERIRSKRQPNNDNDSNINAGVLTEADESDYVFNSRSLSAMTETSSTTGSSSSSNTNSSGSSSTTSNDNNNNRSSCDHYCCKKESEPLPPPLPEPKYSVHKRILPSSLTALSSPVGKKYLLESFLDETAESYFSLIEQFVNQSDPAYCGVTTLLMVLNAMNLDPNVRWKGGWRYFGDEDVLLTRCCINPERIRRVGITMEQFQSLARCQGMEVVLKRPPPPPLSDSNHMTDTANENEIEQFRNDILQVLTNTKKSNENDSENKGIIVVSFSRSALGQTGDGHFSPLAAYHKESDSVLLLDVARFKYSPYWVTVKDLYQSMQPIDTVSQKPRGWYLCYPPKIKATKTTTTRQSSSAAGPIITTTTPTEDPDNNSPIDMLEDRRPAHLVPSKNEKDICPVGKIKVEYCPGSK